TFFQRSFRSSLAYPAQRAPVCLSGTAISFPLRSGVACKRNSARARYPKCSRTVRSGDSLLRALHPVLSKQVDRAASEGPTDTLSEAISFHSSRSRYAGG